MLGWGSMSENTVPLAPLAGSGLHDFLLSFTRRQLILGKAPDLVRHLAWRAAEGRGRPSSTLRREIDDAVEGAAKWLEERPHLINGNGHASGGGENGYAGRRELLGGWPSRGSGLKRSPAASKWQLPVEEALIQKILSKPLRGRLRPWPEGHPFDLGSLYAELNYRLCLTQHVWDPQVRLLRHWQRVGIEDLQWMVPNPFLRCGSGGRFKTDRNAGERIWLIIEFDQPGGANGLEEQAKLLRWLDWMGGNDWDLAMVVYSGGKSLHGWFSCVGRSEKESCRFFKGATTLGCDRMMRSSVQYTRVPGGTNFKTGRRQSIMHYDEVVIAEHQCRLRQQQEI